MKSLKKLVFALPFLAAFPARAAQITSNSLESKIALENSLEKKLNMVLSEALGTDDIIVMISAQLQEQEKKPGLAEILPGIPTEEKMGEKTLSDSLSMVKKITATIILDKSVPKEDEKIVRDLTASLLGLPQDREDLINVERMVFRKQNAFTWNALLYPPNLWFSIFSFLLTLFLFFVVKSFFVPLTSSMRNMAAAMTASSAGKEGEGPDLAGPAVEKTEEKVVAGKSVFGDREPLFGFLRNANLSNLSFIMRNKPVEDLTIVLNYAPEEMSAQIIESLYPQSLQAVKLLPKVVLMPESRIKDLENELRSSLDFVVGGEEKVQGVLQSLDDSVQESVLSAVSESSPEIFKRLFSQIVKFSSIRELEPSHAQLLSRRVGMKNLAVAMKNSDLKDDFILKLSEGMRERFKEELDLIRNVPPAVEKAERRKIVSVIRQLVSDGYISFKGKGEAASPILRTMENWAPVEQETPPVAQTNALPAEQEVIAPAVQEEVPSRLVEQEASPSVEREQPVPPPRPPSAKTGQEGE